MSRERRGEKKDVKKRIRERKRDIQWSRWEIKKGGKKTAEPTQSRHKQMPNTEAQLS